MIRNYVNVLKLLCNNCRAKKIDGNLKLCFVDTARNHYTRFLSSYKPPDITSKNVLSKDDKETKIESSDPSWSKSIKERFKEYRDEEFSIIRDQLEEEQLGELSHEEEELITPSDDPFYGLSLERGVEGVFDVHMLVDVLKGEKAKNICVVRVPKEIRYTNYMVIASGFSIKHQLAVAAFVKKLYKKKRHSTDPFVIVEGETSKTWIAMDMGNIVLHLLMPEDREKYDIESLWAIGSKYDDLSQEVQDEMTDKFEEHFKFLQNSRPLK